MEVEALPAASGVCTPMMGLPTEEVGRFLPWRVSDPDEVTWLLRVAGKRVVRGA